ncbi:MAG: hypothetical protein ACK5QX_03645 [bacterium]|jgi:hypothetical protein
MMASEDLMPENATTPVAGTDYRTVPVELLNSAAGLLHNGGFFALADALNGIIDASPAPAPGEDQVETALRDPATVHINMLRGGIAKPTPAQVGHLYRGDEAAEVIREVARQNPDAARETLTRMEKADD